MQLFEQYCAEIYDAKNYTTATIYPIWALIGLLFLLLPPFILLPCKRFIIIRYLQNGVMSFLKMLDFNVANVPIALRKSQYGDVRVCFPEKQLMRKIKSELNLHQSASQEDETPATPQGFFSETGSEGEKTIYLKKINRIIGGYVTLGLLIVQLLVFLFIYYTWNSAVSEHVTTYSTELTHQPKPQLLKFQFDAPCKAKENIRGQLDSINNIAQEFDYKVTDGSDEGRCNIEASLYLFRNSVFDDNENGTYRGVQFRMVFEGVKGTYNEDKINYKVHTVFAPASHDEKDEYPKGNSALYFIDSCRQSSIPVSTEAGVKLFMSGQVRVKCYKYFGTAAYCSFTDEMISINPSRFVKSSEGQFTVNFEIPNLLLNTYLAHKNDTVMYIVLILCLVSIFAFQPVLKRHGVYIVAITIQRQQFGRGIGFAKGFLMGVVTCLYMYTLSFITFLFLSDVVIDFERLTPSYSFNENLFLFGRDSEFIIINVVLGTLFIIANILISVFIIFFTMMFLGSNADDKIWDYEIPFMQRIIHFLNKQSPAADTQTAYDSVENSDL
mmetsp:Transcript_13974/g.21149  ORF Transcript_13974/g.21149 Transcript_13974/m.21149 type:complete len:553 (+) Transcript_13974:63-1721(+)